MKKKLVPILSMFVLSFMTACNNGSSKSSPAVSVPIMANYPNSIAPGGCNGCMTNPAQTVFMVSTDSNNGGQSMTLSLDFYGDITRGDFNDPKIPLKYSGVIQAKGLFRVLAADTDLCNLPPGDYMVTTMQAGMWQAGTIASLGLSGFGPVNLKLQAQSMQNGSILVFDFVQGIIYNGISLNGVTKLEVNKLGGTIANLMLNGQVCHASLLTTTLPIVLY